MSDGWKTAGSGEQVPAWDFKNAKTKEVEGLYIEHRENVGPNKSNMYILEQKGGEKIALWGTTGLDLKFSGIVIGSEVKVTYEGLKLNDKTKKNYHSFKVDYRELGWDSAK